MGLALGEVMCMPGASVTFKALLVAGIIGLVASGACSSSSEVPAEAEPSGTAEGEVQSESADLLLQPDEVPLIEGPVSPDGLQAIFATSDVGIGRNRIGFVLTSPDDFVRVPEATVSSLFEGMPRETVQAVFRPWPYGIRGLYTTYLNLDAPGSWSIDISVMDPDGAAKHATLDFDVNDVPSAVGVGSPAVRSRNKTLDDVEGFGELTTGSLNDPDLYMVTIADAVTSGLPSVVVMASPAFCTNAVCGPQVEVLQKLKNKYKGQSNFIHVDIYDNPEEIQGDLTKARLSPIVPEWGLLSIEWSFVIDRQGIVTARFQGFATLDELEQALQEVI